MYRLLPLALLLVACAKAPESSTMNGQPEPSKIVATALTPAQMATAMGIEMYPGSTAPEGMSSIPEKRDDGSTHYSMVLATSDTPAKVADWYVKSTGLESVPAGKGQTIIGTLKSGNNVIITIASEAGRTLARVKAITYAKR